MFIDLFWSGDLSVKSSRKGFSFSFVAIQRLKKSKCQNQSEKIYKWIDFKAKTTWDFVQLSHKISKSQPDIVSSV